MMISINKAKEERLLNARPVATNPDRHPCCFNCCSDMPEAPEAPIIIKIYPRIITKIVIRKAFDNPLIFFNLRRI